ncbi:MAG: hypothetical protein H7A33_01060 [Deltaproteobacteria bacterium]|nr:hypothetical protein [Deltaproteobacteria bacterium]
MSFKQTPAQNLDLVSRIYDDVFDYSDFELVRRVLDQSGGPVLDVGCGTGRIFKKMCEKPQAKRENVSDI